MILLQNFFKSTKLIICGVHSIVVGMKISLFFSFNLINLSYVKKNLEKNEKMIEFSKIRFFIIFPDSNPLKTLIQVNNNLRIKSNASKKEIYKVNKIEKINLSPFNNFNKKYRFTDYAGIEDLFSNIQELIIWPTLNYRLYGRRDLETSKGILLSGPTGCGKTLLVHAIAGELNLPIFYLTPNKISNPLSGLNEKKIQNLFRIAAKNSPSIIFIDDIDTIALKRDFNSRDYEKKIIYQLMYSIDELRVNRDICVIIIGATNYLDQLDDSIRRPGRFDKEIEFKIPSFTTRFKILKDLKYNSSFFFDFDVQSLALKTKGYVSGDLFQLISISASFTISRLGRTLIKGKYREKNNDDVKFLITQRDLDKAKTLIDPGLLKNGFTTVSKISWSDIGALDQIKKVLSRYIIEPIRYPCKKIDNVKRGIGILLYGPPGCGKTLLVNAVVHESGANFIFVKGPEVLNKFLGESEKGIRKIFSRAKLFDPTIIFFDEFDSLASKRELFQESTSSSSNDRVVNQLLTEIDSIGVGKRVFFIGATNRPNIIDKALLRPGRIDKILPVPYPNLEGKFLILKTIFKYVSYLPYLNLNLFAESLNKNFTGAELNLTLKEASVDASRSGINYLLFSNSVSGIFFNLSILIGTKNLHYGLNNVIFNRNFKSQFV